MKKSAASPVATVTPNNSNHLNQQTKTNSTHLNNSNYLSSLKSNDASSSSYQSSSITNLNNNNNNKSTSSTYSPSLTTTNTAGTNTNNNSLLNTDMIGSNPSNNSSSLNNTSNHSPHKQSFNKPMRSFIGSTSNGSSSVGGVNNINSVSGANLTDKKIGHREVKDGVVHYKKVPTNELKKAIQFGIVHSISMSSKHQERDLLMQDFQTVETIVFPRPGSNLTPPHTFNDFKLKVYAPYGFKYLRKKFSVDEADFMHSISDTELIEISNPGASGSVFYKTSDDKYLLKTVQYQECEFLKTLLAGIYLNFLQNLINNKYSLLPIIYGLYCYQKLELTSILSDKTNIRVVIMNNILPSDIKMHEKYDLKGSLYKRKASRQERAKQTPTFKDLDFLEEHPDGIILDEKYYDTIVSSLKRDCLILKSFGIMDYSMLLGIHNLEKELNNNALESYYNLKMTEHPPSSVPIPDQTHNSNTTAAIYNLSPSEQKSNKWNKVFSISAVPARSAKGDRLLLYMGIIDILQNYRLKKKLEHTFKSMITDGSQISVCHPDFYESRFVEFLTNKVFKKATLKTSPARRRTIRDQTVNKSKELSSPSEHTAQSQINNTQINLEILPSSSPPSSSYKNYSNIKPIDSVDSISDLKSPASPINTKVNKFENIIENQNQKGDYVILAKKTDSDNLNNNDKRQPITSIVEHYDESLSSHSRFSNDNSSPIQNRNENKQKPLNNLVDNTPKFNGWSTISPVNKNYKHNNGNISLDDYEEDEIEMIKYPYNSCSNVTYDTLTTTNKIYVKEDLIYDTGKLLDYVIKTRNMDLNFDGTTIVDIIIPVYKQNNFIDDTENEETEYRFKKLVVNNNHYSKSSRYH